MEKFDITLFKPNELIELEIEIEGGYVTPVNRLAYNYIIHLLQKNKTQLITFKIADFFNDLNLGKNYDELIFYLDSLQKIRVVSKDKKGKLWGAFNLISYFKSNNNGTFDVEVPSIIFKALCNDDKEKKELYYTAIKLLDQKSFKCSYTGIFYEIFKKYDGKNVNIPTYDLVTLKKITGTLDKYKDYKDFNRYVLKKSLDELNNFSTKYVYSHKEERLGRKVDKIKFIKTEKTEETEKQGKLPPIPSENLLNAIEKAKKNRFIKEKYSQKSVDKAITQFGEELVIAGLTKLSSFEGKVSYFSRLLNSTIKDIQRDEEVNKLTKEKTIKKEEVITPAPAVPKDELSDLDKFKSKVLGQAHSQLSETDWQKLILEIYQAKTKDMVEEIIKKYDLEINLTLI